MTRSGLSRRTVLAGLAAGLTVRVGAGRAAEPPRAGYLLVDLGGGQVLDAREADRAYPAASVVKLVTALYALEALGPDYRFSTRLVAGGPVEDGRLSGDLALVGGGDPVLDTDALGALAAELGGIRAVSGQFRVDAGALPAIDRIADDQPDAAGYNPAIAGVNLNFNRVYLQWVPGASGPKTAVSAPGQRYEVDVPFVRAEVSRAVREPTHGFGPGGEVWHLPARGMRGKGSLWLPVREPVAYAGEVFAALAGRAGLSLTPAGAGPVAAGTLLAERRSAPVSDLLRGMLFHSTNLTAEVLGLRASQARGGGPGNLPQSAAAMTDWARAEYGLETAAFVNHSGLGDRSCLSPREQVRVLARAGDRLPGLLRERPVADGDGGTFRLGGARILAKTGTLDFVSALAGYVECRNGRRLAFAIFAADLAARAAIRPEDRADPPGAALWVSRARAEQAGLLRKWLSAYG